MERYSAKLEQQMQRYYQSLSEQDRRRYAAIEALKLGHGGMSYITKQTCSVVMLNTLETKFLEVAGILLYLPW